VAVCETPGRGLVACIELGDVPVLAVPAARQRIVAALQGHLLAIEWGATTAVAPGMLP
jgi:hypothetical protein